MKNIIKINNTVTKKYHSRIAAENEYKLLTMLKGSNMVPDIISHSADTLEMTYIPGITLSETITLGQNLKTVFEKLADFMLEFNTKTDSIVLDDVNLKNFIFYKDKIYGIDFEKWHYGDNISNLAAVTAVIQTAYFENNDIKSQLYNHIEKYIIDKPGIEKDILKKSTSQQVNRITLRRKAMKKIRQSCCVIIAGGKSSRMGSPKGLLEYNGYTFMDHIICNTSVFDRQYISANDDIYNNFGCDIINDKYKDIGPLGAIHAALKSCESEYVFFIPCDMPFISEETVFHLFDKMDMAADAVVCTAENRIFPTVGIYKKSALPQIASQIERGNYRMMDLLNNISTQYISPPLSQQFKNINTPDDYKNIK